MKLASPARDRSGPAPAPPEMTAAVLAALDRILSTPAFTGSERLCRILRYIVLETLAGRGSTLKEYQIGVDACERTSDFDPKLDAIVRVEAGRLRAKLSRYYAGPGEADAMRIELPRGTYTPVFVTTAATSGRVEPEGVRALRAPSAMRLPLTMACLAALTAPLFKPHALSEPLSIAVLPAVAIGDDRALQEAGDAITAELTRSLSEVPGFLVPASSSAFRFGGKRRDIAAIGRELRVAGVLEQIVQRTGDSLRLTVELTSTADGYNLWSQVLEGEIGPAFERAAAETITRTVRSNFPGTLERPKTSREVLQLCEQGRQQWQTLRDPAVRQAAALFEQAARLDPRYADAYSGLAAAELFLTNTDSQSEEVHYRKAKAAAQKALALNERDAQAHAVLGNIALFHEWEAARAERELQRSLELKPGPSAYERWYALVASPRGHQRAALAELEIGRMANPGSETILTELGRVKFELRHYEEAEKLLRAALKILPSYRPALLQLGLLEVRKANYRAAIDNLRSCAAAEDWYLNCRAALGHALGLAGERKQAVEVLSHARLNTSRALIHLGLGDRSRALACLEKAAEKKERGIDSIRYDVRFESLRAEPDFQRILQRL